MKVALKTSEFTVEVEADTITDLLPLLDNVAKRFYPLANWFRFSHATKT